MKSDRHQHERCNERLVKARVSLPDQEPQQVLSFGWRSQMRAVACAVFQAVGDEDFSSDLSIRISE